MRAADSLARLKNEIINDPAGRGYAGKEPGTIAALLNEPILQSPRQFMSVTPDVWAVLRIKLTATQITALLTWLESQGVIAISDVAAQQVEVLLARADSVLMLGHIEQGDVQDALRS